MRVVVDTNVLFAAIISPNGSPKRLLDQWRKGRFTLLTSKQQIAEIGRVSRYPSIRQYTTHQARGALIRRVELKGGLVKAKTISGLCDDPDDDFLLTIALVGQADYLVFGDGVVGNMRKSGQCKIVKSAYLLAQLDRRYRLKLRASDK